MELKIHALFFALVLSFVQVKAGTFSVDYVNHQFLKDGQPFQYISGSIHYMRVHPYYWNDRLHRIRAMGLNVIEVYVPWNLHEPIEGSFDFSGAQNLTEFLRLAQQNDLYVLLRPGPYICAEWENGGFPYWLLKYPDIVLRTNNTIYMSKVQNYFNTLLDYVKPMLYQNGGPILMVQIENEYGNTGVCNVEYKEFLRDLLWKKLGNDTVLYTTNGKFEASLKCGNVNGSVSTIDFGILRNDTLIDQAFHLADQYSSGGPRVCSEFWVYGCFNSWLQPYQCGRDDPLVVHDLAYMYSINASVNIYMVHGGTNFGFMNGGNFVPTSYDYLAPISENGDITSTYLAIREMIQSTGAANYGQVTLTQIGKNLLSTLTTLQDNCQSSTDPLDFESGLNLDYGYVLYTTLLKTGGKNLSTPKINDMGYVFVNNVYQGYLVLCNDCRNDVYNTSLLISAYPGDLLRILVENKGRDNTGKKTFNTTDRKGLHDNVTLDGVLLHDWIQCAINLTKSSIDSLANSYIKENDLNPFIPRPEKAAIQNGVYVGMFVVNEPQDTFFDSTGWGKGQIFINGFNLGRYWPLVGPQMTLYIPKPYIQQNNTIVLIELIGSQQNYANFIDHPIFSWPNKTVI